MGFNPPLAVLLACLATTVTAEGLAGRTVLFRVETYDDPAAPYLVSQDYTGIVGPGPEFDMGPEGHFALDVVPVQIDVGTNRIDLTYPGVPPGGFAAAVFNGYVVHFPTDCVLITRATIDPAVTSAPFTDAALTMTPQSLSINVAGQAFDKHTRIGVLLDVTDCPVS